MGHTLALVSLTAAFSAAAQDPTAPCAESRGRLPRLSPALPRKYSQPVARRRKMQSAVKGVPKAMSQRNLGIRWPQRGCGGYPRRAL